MYKNCIKRVIDFLLALIGLIILSPIFLILCIWIKCDSRGPILFKQKRVGKNKTHFNILKFRTMSIDTPKDTPTHLLENPDQYITKAGKFLRKTSLDELPQILNILYICATLLEKHIHGTIQSNDCHSPEAPPDSYRCLIPKLQLRDTRI